MKKTGPVRAHFLTPCIARAALGGGIVQGNLFAAFLRADDAVPTCAEFDADWYRARMPDVTVSGLSPWRHFLRFGLAARQAPSPDISLEFVLNAYNEPPERLGPLLYQVMVRRRVIKALPLNQVALQRNQNQFREQIELNIHRQLSRRQHNNLVFVQTAGEHPAAIEIDRSYDIMLNFYNGHSADREADYILSQRGTKVTAIATILQQHPDLLLRYDHVLFLDDDVEIDATSIAEIFAVMERCGLDLAQPALTADSASAHSVLIVQSGSPKLRLVNTVEIMTPVLSNRALERCGWTFGSSISGYGVDLLLGAEVRTEFGDTVAIINFVTARHARPLDRQGGTFYRFMAENGIDPIMEMNTLLKTYEIPYGIRPL